MTIKFIRSNLVFALLVSMAAPVFCADTVTIDFDGVAIRKTHNSLTDVVKARAGFGMPIAEHANIPYFSAVSGAKDATDHVLPSTAVDAWANCVGPNTGPYTACIKKIKISPRGHEGTSHSQIPNIDIEPRCLTAEAGTMVQWPYTTPPFASMITMTFEYTGATCDGTNTSSVYVGYTDLQEMSKGPQDPYELGVSAHRNAHYARPDVILKLKAIAATYHKDFPNALTLMFCDLSLPFGGLFDVNGDWKEPHHGHRNGLHADVSMNNVPIENRARLLAIFRQNGARVLELGGQPNTADNRWHLDFSGPKDRGYTEELRCE